MKGALIFAGVTGLTLAGCLSAKPPASQFPSADDALRRMKDERACVNGLGASAKIDHFSSEGRVRGEIHILAVNPDRVRFDVVSPFGLTLYTLTSDGERFQMLDIKQKEFLVGPASPCNLARITQIEMPGHALVSLLRGEAPVLVHRPTDATVAWNRAGYYDVYVPSTNGAFQQIALGVHPDDFQKPWSSQRVRTLSVKVSQRGADLYQADLSDYEAIATSGPRVDPDGLEPDLSPIGPACGAEHPQTIRMRTRSDDQDLLIQFKDAHWNPPLVAGAFSQPLPSGVTTRFVDCPR